jgi:hypothetical protein
MIKDRNFNIICTKLLFIACLIQIIPTFSSPAFAKKPNRHKPQVIQLHNSHNVNNISNLSYTQQANLIAILRGTNRDNSILSPAIRIEINNQVNSLPQGIQQRLAKGKSLPPGIAKKVELPKTLNYHLKMSPEVKIIVVGSSVMVINPLDNLILDILQNVF